MLLLNDPKSEKLSVGVWSGGNRRWQRAAAAAGNAGRISTFHQVSTAGIYGVGCATVTRPPGGAETGDWQRCGIPPLTNICVF